MAVEALASQKAQTSAGEVFLAFLKLGTDGQKAVGKRRSTPNSASPATTCAQDSPPTGPSVKDTGYLVVNHPTVRDRSTSGLSSSWRP